VAFALYQEAHSGIDADNHGPGLVVNLQADSGGGHTAQRQQNGKAQE
jgi:hypothetical protein